MNRRAVLGAIGSVGSLGMLRYATRSPVSTLHARFWLSERAAAYESVVDRITEYLEFALDFDFWTVDVSYGGTYPANTEDGAAITRSGTWPMAVSAGSAGRGAIESVRDVNLLVTDGQMSRTPTGYAIPHVASVGGARYIDQLSPPDPSEGAVPYTAPNRVMQVLIHEVGHTLGLRHEHGYIYTRDGATVVTPMVSAYAWHDEFTAAESRCGTTYPIDRSGKRLVTHRFSACAKNHLREYAGGIPPW